MAYKFKDYWDALDGAGPKMKERVLDEANNDPAISLPDLKRLVDKAYPDPWA